MILPEYPIYVPSKGRHNPTAGLTVRFLLADFVPFSLVVVPEQREAYDAYLRSLGVSDPDEYLLELPPGIENLMQTRNWIWEHSLAKGETKHWQLDDNIRDIRRLYQGKRIPCEAGPAFRQVEVLTDRYANVPISGMNYQMFVTQEAPSFRWNVHIYSCYLLDNHCPFRFRLIYNDDTDFCLQVLDAGLCTIQSNIFMCDKQPTMKLGGGNTDVLYKIKDGRLKMARILEQHWPGIVKTDWRFGRAQHVIDWTQFKQPLQLKEGIDLGALREQGPDEMGLRLRRRAEIDTPPLAVIAEQYEERHGKWQDRREQ